MEKFETYKNNQKINANVSHRSIAKRYGEVAFFLRKKNNESDFIILDNEDEKSSKISKADVETHCILEINTEFAVDSIQEPKKPQIMQATYLRYSLYDLDNRNTFYSVYPENPSEFIDTGGNTFKVIKKIELILTANILDTYKDHLNTLDI